MGPKSIYFLKTINVLNFAFWGSQEEGCLLPESDMYVRQAKVLCYKSITKVLGSDEVAIG